MIFIKKRWRQSVLGTFLRKALKAHPHDLESVLTELIEKELKKFSAKEFKPTKSKNPRQISGRLRNDVLEKANYQCQFPGCGSTHFLQIDHIVPVRKGGDQEQSNLQVLCANHNQWKS